MSEPSNMPGFAPTKTRRNSLTKLPSPTVGDMVSDSGTGQIESYYDEASIRALTRKIDRRILPLMCAIYFLQYLDKTLLNYASVMGLNTDTKLVGNEYALLGTGFYIGYLVWEPPTNYLMQRLPLAKYLSGNIVVWGAMVALHACAKNFAGLMTLRVLLGVFESCVAPSLVLITGQWYTRAEQSRRLGIWYLQIGIAQMLGSLMSWGLQHLHGAALKNYQILFLLFGLLTIVLGITVYIFLPSSPADAKWLTTEEREMLLFHVQGDTKGKSVSDRQWRWSQVSTTLREPTTWLVILITALTMIDNGAVSNFSSIIIKSFGFSGIQTTLLNFPNGVVTIFATFFSTFLAASFPRLRLTILTALLIPSIIGGIMLVTLPTTAKGALLVGVYLLNSAPAGLPLIYGLMAANFTGYTRKATINALVLMGFCLGNIIGPQSFVPAQAPAYRGAKIGIVVTLAAAGGLCMVLRWMWKKENERREEGSGTGVVVELSGKAGSVEREEDEITDLDNKAFRYVY
ncbi:hypothetical protein G7K_6905-t1 [Saitoella complicata NRRL Y-17804]|uniref:Major facilitator superfamily (MFS) profile domain-containing protein n=2 Tax=Saitoella complicata (strain BCRC 22490 / CBS 7301 / JCM 7358 / NBRC 10748 / NRRL Y-17804) TaxID=698492 RepID=A0A0E9NSJ8_SAICN|nr:hypothetical protein G7K_6905-t1 [Saitoella complicata NRRL Y-17804]